MCGASFSELRNVVVFFLKTDDNYDFFHLTVAEECLQVFHRPLANQHRPLVNLHRPLAEPAVVVFDIFCLKNYYLLCTGLFKFSCKIKKS